jgi:hypothetical protein
MRPFKRVAREIGGPQPILLLNLYLNRDGVKPLPLLLLTPVISVIAKRLRRVCMRHAFFILFFVLSGTASAGRVDTVKCSVDHDGKPQWVRLKVSKKLGIVFSKLNVLADTEKDSVFALLGQDLEESEATSYRPWSGPGGYRYVEVGIPDGWINIGISGDVKQGSYEQGKYVNGIGKRVLDLKLECGVE